MGGGGDLQWCGRLGEHVLRGGTRALGLSKNPRGSPKSSFETGIFHEIQDLKIGVSPFKRVFALFGEQLGDFLDSWLNFRC